MAHLFGTTTRKNLLIGGDFATNPCQRGTTFPNVGTFCVDRWAAYRLGGGGGLTASQQNISFGDGPSTSKSLRLQRDSGQTYISESQLSQCLETKDCIPYAGKWVTLSFWAKAGVNFSSSFSSRIYTGSGTDQQYISAWTPINYYIKTQTLTTTWQKFTQTVLLDTTTTQITCIFSAGGWTGTAGANDYFEIALTQLELGQVSSDFENLSVGEVRELCYRYYENSGFIPGNLLYAGYEFFKSRNAVPGSTAGQLHKSTAFTVTKRATPTVVIYEGNGIGVNTITNGTLGFPRSGATALDVGVNGFPYISLDNTSTLAINLDDKIAYRWTASADL